MKNDKSPSSPPSPAVAPIVLPPSPRYRAQPPSFLDKSQLDLLANEVDSLVREIIEAVPAFSYSLSQGNYGPLPFSINNVRTSAASLTIQGYFEILQIVSASQGAVYTRPSLSRDYTLPGPVQPAPMASHSQMTIDFGQEALNMDAWWPARLRADLREGLLIEAGNDSPQLNLQSISVIPPIPYRQDSTSTEVLSGTYGMPHPLGSEARDVGLQPGNSAGSGRNDQLLEEGRRRWTEYLQGRQ